MKQIAIVEGMKCHHCEIHAENEIKKIAGVKEAKADFKNKEITIDSEDKIKEEDIAKAISAAGYQFKGLK